MNRLEKIVRTARPGAAIHLRDRGYEAGEEADILCDVLALANAGCEGGRLIIMGVAPASSGERRFSAAYPAGHDRPDYVALVNHYIEPALEVAYGEVNVDGAAVGVLHIQRCNDLPYLMRMDHCMKLRRGDGFTRVGGKAVKMGRGQLERIFSRKFCAKTPQRRIEIGFAGNAIAKERRVPTVDLSQRPSELARGKIGQFMNALESASGTGATSVVQRLNHARIFGTEKPYQKRSQQQLMGEFADVGDEMWHEDQDFLFHRHGQFLDIAVLTTGEEALLNITFTLSVPRVDGLHIAPSSDPSLAGAKSYPRVVSDNKQHQISTTVDKLQTGAPVSLFKSAVRFCASDDLAGTRLSVPYELSASNLAAPVMGRLHLVF